MFFDDIQLFYTDKYYDYIIVVNYLWKC